VVNPLLEENGAPLAVTLDNSLSDKYEYTQ
jgi:hypothetical protein